MAITPIKFKLPTASDIKPQFSIKDTTEKLSFGQKVKSLFQPTGYLGSETWKQMLGVGERPSALYETAVKKPIQAVKEYMQPAPGKPIGLFSIPTLKQLPAAFKEAKYTAPAAFISSAADKFIPYRFAKIVDEKLGKYINKLTDPLGTAIGTVLRKAGVRITPEQVSKWAPKAAELDQFISKVEEIKKTQPIINMGGELLGDMGNIALISYLTAPIAPMINKALPPIAQFPGKWDLALRRFITYAPQSAMTFGSIKALSEGARQIETGEFSPTKLFSETLKGVGWGTLTGGTHALPEAWQRYVGAVTVGSGWTTIETLIKNKQLTAKDIPAIVQSGALSLAFEWINSNAVTQAYERELMNSQAKYVWENTIKIADPATRLEVADAINRLDTAATIARGQMMSEKNPQIRQELEYNLKLVETARNKMMAATMYEKDINYIVVDKNMNPIETTTKSLSEILTPQEKLLIQHYKDIGGEPQSVSWRLLEPNPIVQDAMIEYPDLITRADLSLAGKPIPPKPTPTISYSMANIPIGLTIKEVGGKGNILNPDIITHTISDLSGQAKVVLKNPILSEKIKSIKITQPVRSINELEKIVSNALTPAEREQSKLIFAQRFNTLRSYERTPKEMPGMFVTPTAKEVAPKAKPFEAELYRGMVEGPEDATLGQWYSTKESTASFYAKYKSEMTGKPGKMIKDTAILNNPLYVEGNTAQAWFRSMTDKIPELKNVIQDMEVFRGKKPSIEDLKAFDNLTIKGQQLISNYAKQQGYDGVVFNKGEEVVKLPKIEAPAKAEVPTEQIKAPEARPLPPPPKAPAKEVKSEVIPSSKLKLVTNDNTKGVLNPYGDYKSFIVDKKTGERLVDVTTSPAWAKMIMREGLSKNLIHNKEASILKGIERKEIEPTKITKEEKVIMKEATVGKRIPPKGIIERAVGLKPQPEKMITKKESQLLKMKLRAEAKGATEGMRQARADIISQLRISRTDTTDIRRQITDYVKQALDPSDRGKANVLIRDAKNQEDLVKAFSRIDRWAENAEKKAIRNDVVSSVKKAIESPAVAVDYKAKIKEVIDEFELKGHLGRTLEKLNATKKYIDERLALGEDIEIPQRIWNSLKILTRKPYEEMTISEMKGLQDEVKILDAVGRMKWATYKDIYKLEQDAIKDALVEGSVPMARREKIVPKIGERLSINQTFKNYVISLINQAQKIDKVVLPMDAIFDSLDGAKGTFSGTNTRLIKGKMDKDWNLWHALEDESQESTIKKAIESKIKPETEEKIGFVAAREQENGVEKLKQVGYTEEEINAVQLTKEEQELYDMMRAEYDRLYPYVVDIMRKVYNMPVGKVKNYFPWMTDWTKTDEAEIYKRMGPGAEEFGLPTKTVEHGFTIPRKAMAKQKIKLNAMSIFLRHTSNVAYLRAFGRDIKMLSEIVNSDEYKESAGELGQLLVVEWLDLMARKGGSAGSKQIAIIDWLRHNIGPGMVGFKISSAAVQWTEVIPAMGLIGPEYGMKGIFNIVTSKDWREFVMKFPEIKDRAGGETAIRELIDGSAFRKLQAKAFIPLQWVDTWAATSVVAGAYEKKMAELGKEIDLSKEPNQEAMEYAQQIVRRNQGVAGYKDIPLAISRGALTGSTSFDRALLQFQNFVLFRWSRIRYEALKAGMGGKDYLKTAGILFWTLVGMLAAVGTKMGVDALSDFVTGKERKDTEAMKKMIYEIVGSVPFLGNLYGSYLYDNELIPIFSAPSEALQDLKKAITSKNPNTRAKGLSGFITTLMTIMGVPGMLQTQQILNKAIPSTTPKQLMPPSKKSPTPPAPSKPSSLKSKSNVENLLANIFKRELT